MLSDTAEYALRAVLYIAQHEDEGPVRAEMAAEALHVPRNYLSKILHALAKEGVLSSTRGPHGGFRLGVPAKRLKLFQIVQPFDSLEPRRTCLLGRPECSDRNPCAAHERWKTISDQVAVFFRQTTVATLIEEAPAGESV